MCVRETIRSSVLATMCKNIEAIAFMSFTHQPNFEPNNKQYADIPAPKLVVAHTRNEGRCVHGIIKCLYFS